MEQINATRMNLLRLRQQMTVVRKGLTLLENKREALVREFFLMVESATTARGNLRQKIQEAQNHLTLSLGTEGWSTLESIAYASKRDISIEIVEKNIWGVRFPEIHYPKMVRALDARGYGITGTTAHLDETVRQFEEILEQILKTVSIEIKLKRMGQEIKKATRRINALKERIFPFLNSQIKRLMNHLEEREHEDVFRIKQFKKKREAIS